jgi:hypothetical protein
MYEVKEGFFMRYVEIYVCTKCGRCYQKEQLSRHYNRYPNIPDKCTFLYDYNGLHETYNRCGGTEFMFLKKELLADFKEYICVDMYSVILKERMMKELTR